MGEINVKDVFGVKKERVLSYYNRENVDMKFEEELKGDKHIVIYGSSKQGKSALVQQHIPEENSITVGCSTAMTTKHIYASLLRQLGIKIISSKEKEISSSGEATFKTTFKAMLPFFGEGGADISGKISGGTKSSEVSHDIEYNLSISQDVSELLKEVKFNKFIIIENFHYLEEEVQRILSIDLRLFQENNVRFIILGIWREKNRLLQFNRDLIDRLVEIPVEPWLPKDFDEVILKGSKLLNIEFSEVVKTEVKEIAFGNIGIVQELCKEICLESDVVKRQKITLKINNEDCLEKSIEKKVDEYASSHIRSLESISDSGQIINGLYLSYYLVRVIVESHINDLRDGISKSKLQEEIKKVHYRGKDVRGSDMTNLLHKLAERQSKKMISPPLFDYDRVNRRLRIIDSTLMFFLNFKDKKEIMEEIICPIDSEND
ncbi:hypothetical protein CSV78_15205 [Sporosarcina sp. P16a]|uniref:hypothetical protein n=1 Tax=unclassified Sporosarcina TaxID=2647733 RepID=UPI000C16D68C|nr:MULTISPECIES: hypothetical protein [unclassified Sporosarcina]PIC65915.1 hypothetical protein CSV78_15205 [Sporosarcina sp. P16a]PIC91982.1 hypothetical protein CSV70_12620 [Sporosarcina sp. P25]